jgi:glycosyltransferase involved in cell wall biosynthesis
MKRALHVSANQYPELAKHHFTKKIWIELAKGFDEYHILARSESNRFESFNEGNLHLHLVPALGKRDRSYVLSSFYMLILIKRHKITHILAQSALFGGVTAALASRMFRIPLMTEIHGDIYFRIIESEGSSLLNRILSKAILFVYNSSVVVRSLSSAMTRQLRNIGVENVVEIPNRVDLALFNRTRQYSALNNPVKIISIGRFVEQKGFTIAIEAIKRLSQRTPVHLTLVGGGRLYDTLNEEAKGSSSIRLISWVKQEDLVELMVQSDIYIQPSIPGLGEAMPRTILEAMAVKLPVIASNIAAIPGVIRHEENGLLIDAGSASELEKAIVKLINDQSLRHRISENAYNDVVHKYSWTRVFENYRSTFAGMARR